MVFALEGLVLGKRDTGSLATLGCFEFGGDIVFCAGKSLCAKSTLCSDLVLALFFSQMASQKVRSTKGLLTSADKPSRQR